MIATLSCSGWLPFFDTLMHKFNIKLFAESDSFTPTEFVPIFHRWIQGQSLPDHVLIDVADYAHVPDGPGTLLVADEANLHMDRGHGRLGLMYVRKRPIHGTAGPAAQLAGVLRETLVAANLLEAEPELAGRLSLSRDDFVIRLNDRLHAPNTPESAAAMASIVKQAVTEVMGNVPVELTADAPSPLDLMQFRVQMTTNSVTV